MTGLTSMSYRTSIIVRVLILAEFSVTLVRINKSYQKEIFLLQQWKIELYYPQHKIFITS